MVKTIRLRPFLVALAGVLLLSVAGCSKNKTGSLQLLQTGGDFTLSDDQDQPFALSSLRGKAVLLYFGYTACPDACPMALGKISQVYKILGEKGLKPREQLQTLFITLDPERDSSQKLRGYLKYFSLPVIGLRGSLEETARVAALYKVIFNKNDSGSAAGYSVDHSTNIFLVDQEGKLRYIFSHKDSSRFIADLVSALLQQAAG